MQCLPAYCSDSLLFSALAEEQAEAKKKQEAEEYQRALYDIMSCMRDVRKRSERTDAMFEPLKETATLLHTFGIQLNDAVLKQLENAEFKWKGLKKKMLNRREQLAALQQAEAVEIRRKSDGFAERVDDYRKWVFELVVHNWHFVPARVSPSYSSRGAWCS